MGLNKLEKNFRVQLNQREINPTPAAWDRLDAMLTVAEEEKVKPIFNWVYIAASIIGFLAIGYVFLNNPSEVVDAKRNEVVIDNTTPSTKKDSLIKEQQMLIPIQKKEKSIAVSQSASQKQSIVNSNAQQFINQTAKQSNPIANSSVANASDVELQAEKSAIDQKIIEIVQNQLAQSSQENAITEREREAKTAAINVNAASLLSKVDSELEISFREKAIMKINKNYKAVKVALANRNQTNKQ